MNPKFKKSYHWEAKDTAFADILSHWVSVCRKYAKDVAGDWWWNYSERPCIGFLAAAAWKSGGVALEEWATKKWTIDDPPIYGRGDVWIRHQMKDFFIEGRHIRVTLKECSDFDKAFQRVKDRFDGAIECADRQKVERQRIPQKKLGVIFIGMTFPKNDSSLRATWLYNLAGGLRPSALAWMFISNKDKTCGFVLLGKTTEKLF
jgi:hypothetical protein